MDSPAQKRAKAKYRKKVRTTMMQFYPNNETDAKIYAHIQKQPKKNQYLKSLVLRDMEQE
jgi:hypothetical protein